MLMSDLIGDKHNAQSNKGVKDTFKTIDFTFVLARPSGQFFYPHGQLLYPHSYLIKPLAKGLSSKAASRNGPLVKILVESVI